MEQADIVILGSIVSVKDTASRKDLSGSRLIEVFVEVQRVLKGRIKSPRICFAYAYPNGGVTGRRPHGIALGEMGVFSLLSRRECYRVVNDAYPIVKVYDIPEDTNKSLNAFVAEALLPLKRGCPTSPGGITSNISSISNEIGRNSISLIGARAARELMANTLAHPDPHLRECYCALALETFGGDEPCAGEFLNSRMIVELFKSAVKFRERDFRRFQNDPVEWLQHAVDGGGWDRTLLRLGAILKRSALSPGPKVCDSVKKEFLLGRFIPDDLIRDGYVSSGAERKAKLQFNEWVEAGCPRALPTESAKAEM